MNAEAKTLADGLREMAAGFRADTARQYEAEQCEKAADFLDRLSAPVEGAGLTRYGLVRHGHFEAMIEPVNPERYDRWISPLRGKNLACWCKPGDPCHADVLLDLANRDQPK